MSRWVCVAMAAAAAVAAVGMLAGCQGSAKQPATSRAMPARVSADAKATDEKVARITSEDGQPLVLMEAAPEQPPGRPADPRALPDEDAGRWYDLEYAGWNTQKVRQPASPADGARGKRVVCLRFMDHPYLTAYSKGMQKIADAYGIQVKTMVANNDNNIQAQQVDQVLNDRPDLVIILPVEATAVVPLLRKMNQRGMPVIASNLIPVDEGMKYILTWTGPDDWGQFRMLARDFAKRMSYEGGYCIVRHMPGSSPFFSRTFAPITELKKIAPKMQLLDMQATNLQAEKTLQVVSDWITRFGPRLKGIISADDSGAQIGINQAIRQAHREDIIRVAAGNSKTGMDFVKAGTLHAITYQSAEADGALPMKLAADWFNGKPIQRPVYYLPKHIITKVDVDRYMPAQW